MIARLLTLAALGFTIALCARVVLATELERLSLDVESFYSKGDAFLPEYSTFRRPQLPYQQQGAEQWSYSLGLTMNLLLADTVLGKTYWNNRVTGASTTKQFRYVGYEFRFLHQFTPGIGIFYHHHSEHGLDIEREAYPLHDSFGVVFCLAGRQCDD